MLQAAILQYVKHLPMLEYQKRLDQSKQIKLRGSFMTDSTTHFDCLHFITEHVSGQPNISALIYKAKITI